MSESERSDKEQTMVLIVEDDKDWCEKLVHYLQYESYQIEIAEDFHNAIDLLQKNVLMLLSWIYD